MSDNYYSEINLHLTWHTKLSRPLLTPEIETMTFGCLREKAADLGDVYIHEIGGTATHVHVTLSIEPTVLISELIGTLKGYPSHEVNRRMGLRQKVLQWQTGYGVVSFGTADLPWVVAYVRNQKNITRTAGSMSVWNAFSALMIGRLRLKPTTTKPRERGSAVAELFADYCRA